MDLFLPQCTLYGPTQLNPCEKRIMLKKINEFGIQSSYQPNNLSDRKEKNHYSANELTHSSNLERLCKQLHSPSMKTF